MLNHKFRNALKRQTVHTGSQFFFNGPNGPFHFTHVAVGRNNVDDNGEEFWFNAFKFVIAMKAMYAKTTSVVDINSGNGLAQDGVMVSIRDGLDGAVADIARNRMKERKLLDVKKISTKHHIDVVFQNRRGNRDGLKIGDMWSRCLRGDSLNKSNVRAIDGQSSGSIRRGDRAISNEVAAKDALKISFGRTTYVSI